MRLLGPVFWYDMVRVARRQPLTLWRTGYGLGLLLALFLLYFTAFPGAWLGGYVPDRQASAFATLFFDVFTAIQFAAVVLMTPALTANAIAEEKGNNTLIFLLTTHLTNREIVLGKLTTRLLQVGLLILTGLPTLALLQLMGGVYLPQVIANFAALALTALSLGCLGLACGVFVRKPQMAAWRAYQILIGYLALSFLSIWYWDLPGGVRAAAMAKKNPWIFYTPGKAYYPYMMSGPTAYVPTVFDRSLDWFNVLNPYYAHLRLADDLQASGDTIDQALMKVLRDYAIAHGGLALLLGGLAIVRLRAVAAKQSAGIAHKKKLILRPAPHPPVRDRPILWKELYCESKPRQRWLRLFFGRWFFCASFFPAFFFIVLSLDGIEFGRLAERTLFLLRYLGTLVVGLLCLRVALHAARSVGSERDRQTLDSLLTTQLRPAEIIGGKWWGSFLSGRWIFVWLVIHWCLGMLPFALYPLAIPLLMLETIVYAAFAASLGLYCSVRFATTRQAITATLVIGMMGAMLMPWAAGKAATIVLFGQKPPPPTMAQLYNSRNPYEDFEYQTPWPERLGSGLTPPWVLIQTVMPFRSYDYLDGYEADRRFTLFSAFGLLVYALAAIGLKQAAARHFRRSLPGHSKRPVGRRAPPSLLTVPLPVSDL